MYLLSKIYTLFVRSYLVDVGSHIKDKSTKNKQTLHCLLQTNAFHAEEFAIVSSTVFTVSLFTPLTPGDFFISASAIIIVAEML